MNWQVFKLGTANQAVHRCFWNGIHLPSACALLVLLVIVAKTMLTSTLYAAEFIPFGISPGSDESWANSVSDDGLVVVGNEVGTEGGIPFRWTEQTGKVVLGPPSGYDRARVGQGWDVLSGDGSTIVGQIVRYDPVLLYDVWEAAIYTVAQGWEPLGFFPGGGLSAATAVSFDGNVVVGFGGIGPPDYFHESFRWTEAEGMVGLGLIPGGQNAYGAAAVSADGSVVVLDDTPHNESEDFYWSESTGMVGLGVTGRAREISADGTVIGGRANVTSASDVEAYLWTEETGAVGLGWMPGTGLPDGSKFSSVQGISSDGSVIVGFSGDGSFSSPTARAYIRTEESGMQDLQQLLIDQYGLGPSLEGWNLWGPMDISANGKYIAGVGVNPDGNFEGWLVRLDAPGDFDVDGDVDGFDFLKWQRGFGDIYDSNDLADWEANYGMVAPLVAASTAVPEPSSLVVGAIACLVGVSLRRRS